MKGQVLKVAEALQRVGSGAEKTQLILAIQSCCEGKPIGMVIDALMSTLIPAADAAKLLDVLPETIAKVADDYQAEMARLHLDASAIVELGAKKSEIH